MKAVILLVALLAVATARISISDAYVSFAKKLNFTQEMNLEVKDCAMEVAGLSRQVSNFAKSGLKAKAAHLLLASDAEHREFLQHAMQHIATSLPKCGKFAQTFFTHINNKSLNTYDEITVAPSQRAMYRYQKNSAELMAAVGTIGEAIINADGKTVGEQLAFIVEVMTGVAHPDTIMDYAKKYSQPIGIEVMEPERFIVEFVNTLASEFGFKGQVTEERAKEIIRTVQGIAQIVAEAKHKIALTTSVFEREVVTLGIFRDLVIAGKVLLENVQLTLHSMDASLDLLTLARTHFAQSFNARAQFKVMRNMPAIQRHAFDIGMAARSFRPVQAAKAFATMIKLSHL